MQKAAAAATVVVAKAKRGLEPLQLPLSYSSTKGKGAGPKGALPGAERAKAENIQTKLGGAHNGFLVLRSPLCQVGCGRSQLAHLEINRS